jgi:murein DD-endopeptidase MepM/ murein hydrolase activator NlpD
MKNFILSVFFLLTSAACTQDPARIEQKGEIIYSMDSERWGSLATKRDNYNSRSTIDSGQEIEERTVKPLVREEVSEHQEVSKENKVNIITDQKSMFSWPVSGKVIAEFGEKEGGAKHDGINIEAIKGTDVKAARGGEVVYSGNELTGYGNLIIIKHDNGWLSAYGHLEKVEVRKGAKVKVGDIIGHVGQSGNVLIPQLHFALRMAGKKPVDPLLYLPKRLTFDQDN